MKVTVNFEGCQIELQGVYTPETIASKEQAADPASFYLEQGNNEDIDRFIWRFMKVEMEMPKPTKQDHSEVFDQLEELAIEAAQKAKQLIRDCADARMAEAKRLKAMELKLQRQLGQH